jgi:hypothetical protein
MHLSYARLPESTAAHWSRFEIARLHAACRTGIQDESHLAGTHRTTGWLLISTKIGLQLMPLDHIGLLTTDCRSEPVL